MTSTDKNQSDRTIHLHYDGGTAVQHYIAAGQFATSIDALRRTVELTALEALGIELRERDRLPTDLQRQFGLYISAPKQSSLGVDAVVGGPITLLGADADIDAIATKFKEAWQALSAGEWSTLSHLFPDRLRLHRWIDAAKRAEADGAQRFGIVVAEKGVSKENRPEEWAEILEASRLIRDETAVEADASLGLLTVNALTAAHGVLIPLEAEYFALRGVALLIDTIDKVKERLNPALQLDGIVSTMYDARTLHAKEVLERVVEGFGDTVLETVIGRTVKFPDASVAGKPITEFAPQHASAKTYRQLARELVARGAIA